MYANVRAEMARNRVTLAVMAEDPRIDCTVTTLSNKLNGKAPLLFKEAVAIKELVKTDLTLEELFKEEES